MGVYIKGMEMPDHCYDCDFNNGRTCFANEEKTFDIIEEYAKRIKHPDCPLIEVPEPHGRLIDADMAYQETMKYGEHFRKSVLNVINNLPTVIESKVEE